jgi:hypothetical protein
MPRKQKRTVTKVALCTTQVFGKTVHYPCLKRKTVTKWCYAFDNFHRDAFALMCRIRACEGGTEYIFWRPCFGVGSANLGPVKKCYKNKLEPDGECSITPTRPRAAQALTPEDFPSDAELAGNDVDPTDYQESCESCKSFLTLFTMAVVYALLRRFVK